MRSVRRLAFLVPVLLLAAVAWLSLRASDGGADEEVSRTDRARAAAGRDDGHALLAPGERPISGAGSEATSARAPGFAVRGRVLDELSREPVEGCKARLWTLDGVVAEVTTGRDGRFAFARPDAEEAWVDVSPAEGFRIREEPMVLEEDPVAQGELLFHARREAARAPLRLALVDATNGAPVPLYALQLFAADSAAEPFDSSGEPVAAHVMSELVTSDAKGYVDSEAEYAAGAVFYTEIDFGTGSRWLHQHAFSHAGLLTEDRTPLAVHLGPTYYLSLTLPEGTTPERFYVRIVPDSYSYRRSSNYTAPLRESELGGGEQLWARFRPLPEQWTRRDSRTDAFRLEVHDKRYRWFGAAPVISVEGVHPGVVRVDLARLATLSGRVLDRRGEPVQGATVRLDSTSASLSDSRFQNQNTRINGAFLFKGIHPGTYLLRARTRAHGLAELPITFDGRADVERDITLIPVPTGRISGRVVSRTGTFAGGTWLSLSPREDRLVGFDTVMRVRFKETGGELEGRFSFGELPIGEYALSIEGDERIFEPTSIVVTPPAEELVFTCLDDVPVTHLAFEARDARTGAAPKDVYVFYRLAGATFEGLHDGELAQLNNVRADEPLEWWLLADGYQPAHGDGSAFRDSEEWFGEKVARVALEPGWGRIVRVEDEASAALAGAAVYLAGERVAETGLDGCVVVGAAQSPVTYTATHGALVERTATVGDWDILLTLGLR